MKHIVESELRDICSDIVDRDLSVDEWREAGSTDEFQGDRYQGGYDAEEDAFRFTYFGTDSTELFFQFTLEEAADIAGGGQKAVEAHADED